MTYQRLSIDPKHTALLVMDYQLSILGSLSEAEGLLSRMGKAIAVVRQYGVQVAYVRVAFDDADYDAVPETSRMAPAIKAAGRALHSESPATAVHHRVAPDAGDIVVRKTRMGAFSTTDLDARLRERQIHTLILAGVTTSGVVLSTVRDAHDRDYQVYILEDAMTDRDPHVHDFLVKKIFPQQAHVITIDELGGLLSSEDEGSST
ncbi:cysteine hydrolase family protein [Sulfobacillus harzensis]|uniref:Cysteine hydrolase n=1 Tax=Sulfobacillus harzensis TaxID=2729629 RepID=A0A7Y0L7C8_9FIRM|nr:isochorismatase family cysteine hydrolase [Sulfobacillus harzensis]NMP24657.1 cysteine hydrolase [Sulfobacillus harzensis]